MNIQVRGLRISAAERQIVHGISFSIAAGEALGLIGSSGSGKSLTARSLLGLAGDGVRVEAETMRLGERDLLRLRERDWQRVRGREIGLVLQDALGSLDPARTIGAELATAIRLHERGLSAAVVRERAIGLLRRVGLEQPEQRLSQRASELSGGQRQRALIAAAIAHQPKLLIADEPTSALDALARRSLLKVLRQLADAGMAILFVSHDLASVEALCERVAVIDTGQIVETGPTARILTAAESVPARALVHARPHPPKPTPDAPVREPVLRAEHLVREYRGPRGTAVRALDVTEITLRRGETLGVVGASGSGKSTLARQLLALDAPGSPATRITLDGAAWVPAKERNRRRLRHEIGFVPQDPLASFDPRLRVEQILADALTGGRTRRVSSVRERAVALLTEVGLSERQLQARPVHLSGGQRQRLAIARALAPNPRILICDEAVSALDATVRRQILDLIARAQRDRDLACLFIAHDLDVIGEIADLVMVLDGGRVVEVGPTWELFQRPTHPATVRLLNDEAIL